MAWHSNQAVDYKVIQIFRCTNCDTLEAFDMPKGQAA